MYTVLYRNIKTQFILHCVSIHFYLSTYCNAIFLYSGVSLYIHNLALQNFRENEKGWVEFPSFFPFFFICSHLHHWFYWLSSFSLSSEGSQKMNQESWKDLCRESNRAIHRWCPAAKWKWYWIEYIDLCKQRDKSYIEV